MEVTRNLDCNTPKGKKFIQSQKETGFLIERFLPPARVEHTSDDAERFDCYIDSDRDSSLIGVGEIKTRPFFSREHQTICTLEKLKYGGYLITAEKLDILSDESKKHGVTSYIFVNLPNDRKLLVFKISKSNGEFFFDFKRQMTTTKYSCNDFKGDTVRENAFLPIIGNKYFKSFNY
jgi:hypothetical protein